MLTSQLGSVDSTLGNIELGYVNTGGGPTTYNEFLTLNVTSKAGPTEIYGLTLTVAGTSSFNQLPGQPYNLFAGIAGTAGTSQFHSGTVRLALSIDASASIPAPVTLTGKSISVDASAALDVAIGGTYNAQLTVAASASAVTSNNANYAIPPVTFAVISAFYPETFYNFLVGVTSLSSVTVSQVGIKNQPETTSATSGLNIASQAIYTRTVGQTFTPTQTLVRSVPNVNRTVTQTFVPTQSIKRTKIVDVALTQHITFTAEQYPLHPVYQTLTISQAIVAKKVHNVTVKQTLLISQTIRRPGTFARNVAQTLKFNTPQSNLLPIFNGQQVGYPTSNIYVSLVPRKCRVILSVPARTIVLPCPELNDSQGLQGTIDLKRSMTGDTFTYIRRSRQNKLKYSFQLSRQKALELRDYLIAFASVPMTLINWKGETWYGTVASSPLDFSTEERWQPVGERTDINLEFDVIKIGG